MTLNTNEAIQILETSLNLTFSDEQIAILHSGFNRPVLVNACAGSGKTTIFMLASLVAIMTDQTKPESILGITFSKMAQTDMAARYQDYVKKLPKDVVSVSNKPYFSTFHALFYRLLMKDPEFTHTRVLATWTPLLKDLSSALIHGNPQMSDYEVLEQIFQLKDYLNNMDLSHDGYNFLDGREFRVAIREIEKELRSEHTAEFYDDYLNVVALYEDRKRAMGLVDFNDMKNLLLESMQDSQNLALYRKEMDKYSLVFLDEFQDIDPQQWEIISQLLNNQAMSRLIAIGDDDQSIYRFRGSSPEYLLKFGNYVPNAKTYALSTNYRTGGAILDSALPLLKMNKNRLEKKLSAYNEGVGKIYIHKEKESVLDIKENTFVESFIRDYNNPTIPNKEIAILVRYNQSRTFIADYLAARGINVNIQKKKLILQNDKIYCIYMDLVKAFWEDKFGLFSKNANKIGFKKYQKFIIALKKQNGYSRLSKLSVFIEMLDAVDLNSIPGDIQEYNRDVVKVFKATQNIKQGLQQDDSPEKQKKAMKTLLALVSNLTNTYFSFMTDKKFISKNKKSAIFDYLEQLADSCANVDTFLKNEQIKKKNLENELTVSQEKGTVSLLSLHQSKGLEFQHVYLFGLDNTDLPDITERMYRWFEPDTSYAKFVAVLIQMTKNKVFNRVFAAGCESLQFKSYQDIKRNGIPLEEMTKNIAISGEVPFELHALYVDIMQFVNFVEEERRLLYVGITRSKKSLFIDIPRNPNPLLFELDLSKSRELKEGETQNELLGPKA